MTAYLGQTGMLRELLFTSTVQQPKATDGVGRMMEERRDGVPRYFTGMVAYGVGGALTLCQGFCMPIKHLLRESKDCEQSPGNFQESGVGKERI